MPENAKQKKDQRWAKANRPQNVMSFDTEKPRRESYPAGNKPQSALKITSEMKKLRSISPRFINNKKCSTVGRNFR